MDVRLLDNPVKMEGPVQVIFQFWEGPITNAHVLMAILG